MRTIISFAIVVLLAAGCSAPPSINVPKDQPPRIGGFTGDPAPTGIVDPWRSLTELWFDFNGVDLPSSELNKLAAIKAYIDENPSLQVGIDGSLDPLGTEMRGQNLGDLRVGVVRDALIEAGVPAYKIRTGAFGAEGLTEDQRVGILVSDAHFLNL